MLQLTHGFPKTSSPMFASSSFPIENRPQGTTDVQTMSKVVSSLRPIVISAGENDDVVLYEDLSRWAGDWHLLDYLRREGGFEDVSRPRPHLPSPSLPRTLTGVAFLPGRDEASGSSRRRAHLARRRPKGPDSSGDHAWVADLTRNRSSSRRRSAPPRCSRSSSSCSSRHRDLLPRVFSSQPSARPPPTD